MIWSLQRGVGSSSARNQYASDNTAEICRFIIATWINSRNLDLRAQSLGFQKAVRFLALKALKMKAQHGSNTVKA